MIRVLIADDDEFTSGIIARHLQNEGFEVRCVYDGESALAEARKLKPDLIVLDIMLPKKDGFQVAIELAAEKSTAGVPVIVTSNDAYEETRQKMLKISVVKGYLIKAQATPESIVQEIKKVLAEGTI